MCVSGYVAHNARLYQLYSSSPTFQINETSFWRFGIGRDRTCTLEEIGQLLGLSRERVRQLEKVALRKIRASHVSRLLREVAC